jgi:hypothetical protein
MNIERGIKKLDELFKARPDSDPHIGDLELGFEDLREILQAMKDESAHAEKECELISISREVAEEWLENVIRLGASKYDMPMYDELREALGK